MIKTVSSPLLPMITIRYANTEQAKQTYAGQATTIHDVASASPADNV